MNGIEVHDVLFCQSFTDVDSISDDSVRDYQPFWRKELWPIFEFIDLVLLPHPFQFVDFYVGPETFRNFNIQVIP